MAHKAEKSAAKKAVAKVVSGPRERKTFSKYRTPFVPIPNLVENQLASYKQFLEKDLAETIKEFSPMKDYSEKKFELVISSIVVNAPDHDENHAKANKLTYEAELKARVKLKNKVLGGEKEQEIFLSELPLMTPNGTFIINGAERVIVPQLARSSGVSFTDRQTKKGRFFGAKIIPARGAWIEVESESDNVLYIRIDKKRKFVATSLLRVLGAGSDEEILKMFKNEVALGYLKSSLQKTQQKQHLSLM